MSKLLVYSDDEVLSQDLAFKADWWRRYLTPPWWPSALDELPEDPARPGYQRITRADVFTMAQDPTPMGRVHLLLAAFVWGTGEFGFLVGRRVRVFTRTDLEAVGKRLVSAAELQHGEGPVAAYASLLRGGPNYIKFLGPSFFTKYLYFAAGHPPRVNPAPLILDKFVALGLNSHPGWSISSSGWSADTYYRYLTWAAQNAGPDAAPHGVEMALFQSARSSVEPIQDEQEAPDDE